MVVMEGGGGPTTGADPASLGEARDAAWGDATRRRQTARQPPRWWFHVAAALPSIVLLWSASLPGTAFVPVLWAVGTLLLLGVVWAVRVVLVLRDSDRRPRAVAWLAVAPLGGLLVGALLVTEAPLTVRWAHSRAAFEEAVVAADDPRPDRGGSQLSGFPRRLGTYDILWATADGDATAFFEDHGGGILTSAGFVHLPEPARRDEVLSGISHLEPLGDDWYTFTLRA